MQAKLISKRVASGGNQVQVQFGLFEGRPMPDLVNALGMGAVRYVRTSDTWIADQVIFPHSEKISLSPDGELPLWLQTVVDGFRPSAV